MDCNMEYKSQIVADLGVDELLIPRLINEALSPNISTNIPYEFLTEPKEHKTETRCYMRDPDGYIIEVGQSKNS
jgi:hypothetical protein